MLPLGPMVSSQPVLLNVSPEYGNIAWKVRRRGISGPLIRHWRPSGPDDGMSCGLDGLEVRGTDG